MLGLVSFLLVRRRRSFTNFVSSASHQPTRKGGRDLSWTRVALEIVQDRWIVTECAIEEQELIALVA
jgi:hypothetical protein